MRSGQLIWPLVVIILAVLGAFLPVYWVYLLSTVAIGALIARGIGVVTGQVGMITLCQMSFAAVGGWGVSWAALAAPGIPFPLLVLGGGIAALPIGLLLGAVTARIRGAELAVVTLGFAAALDLVLRNGAFPGVGSGTPVIPTAPFDDPRWFFAFAWVMFAVLQLGVYALSRTPHGLSWGAIRGSERAAAALGVRVVPAKASAFGASALFAGVAGGLLAGQYGLLTPDVFSPLTSMVHLVTAVLAGAALCSGAVLAGVFAVFMPELLRRVGLPIDVGNALLALGAFDVLRRGTGGIAEQVRAKLQDRAFRDARTACTTDVAETASGDGLRTNSGRGDAGNAAPLAVHDLTVTYGGSRVLDRVSLTVHTGEVHALIGPNGAGKSTLVDAATGFLGAYTGSVLVAGDSLQGRAAHERARLGIRRTFQHSRGLAAPTVGDYLRLAAPHTAGAERDGIRTYFGLPEAHVPTRLLDVGTRRTLEIAGALAARPRVLLLDEPAAGLGADERAALAARVRAIPERYGCAVLVIEHDMEFVRAAAETLTVLEAGEVIASGPIADTLELPRVIAAYLGKETAR